MSTPYIPTRDDALDAWALNFSTLITASPATYGLFTPDAVAIANAYDTYHDAFIVGGSSGTPPAPVNPSTFTRVTVAAKNSAKIAGVTLWRTYASQIRINPGVLNSDKLALGLNLPNNTPSPIPAPSTFPVLGVVAVGPGVIQLRYADNTTPASRKKPQGALQMELWRGIGTAEIVDPLLCTLNALVTKQPFVSSFSDPTTRGKIATFFARWNTRTGLVGPWSAGITQVIG